MQGDQQTLAPRPSAVDVSNDPFMTHAATINAKRPPSAGPASPVSVQPPVVGSPVPPLQFRPPQALPLQQAGSQFQTLPPPQAEQASSQLQTPALHPDLRSGIQQNAPQPAEPIVPVWYPAESNWNMCLEQMAVTFREVTSEFTGQALEEQRLMQATMMQKAGGALFEKTGGVLGKPNEPNTMTQKVYDLFQDINFPARHESWFRGGESDDFASLPTPWRWIRLMEFSMDAYPSLAPEQIAAGRVPKAGRVYQGQLEDFYLVAALQTIGMKPQLIANLFVNMDFSNPQLGLYTLRLYKHGQWVSVEIDDALPFDKEFNPLTCSSEFWPDYGWPALVEKAYAKLHGSWQALGGGGHVEEVLTDLTGGCSTRFGTRDVAPDRLWQYLHEMQRWCVFGCNINEVECSKRGIPIQKHWASSVFRTARHQGIPYVCVCTAAPIATLRHMQVFDIPSPDGYGINDGMAWLRVDDFVVLFDTIYECRLVNSDLGPPQMTGIPYSPGYIMGYPWFEELWAFQGDVYSETAPSFIFDIRDCPSEITLDVSQTDLRYKYPHEEPEFGRGLQAPLLLRFYQCSDNVSDENGGEIFLVHLSAWGHTRDASCGVKVLRPGKYMAMVSIPAQYVCHRMIFRTYSTRPLATKVVTQHRNFIAVAPAEPLGAMPYSLCGMMHINTASQRLPQLFNEAEGRGLPMANPMSGTMTRSGGRANQVALANLHKEVSHHLSKLPVGANKRVDGMKVVGKFGGSGAVATMSARESQEGCALM